MHIKQKECHCLQCYLILSLPHCCRRGVPSRAPKVGSYLTLRKELFEEIHTDKARDFIGKGHPGGEQQGWENPGELLCHVAVSPGFYDGISFRVVFGQSFWLRVLPGGSLESFLVCITQTRWMLARGILGGGRTCSVSFWPFLTSSGWWWLITSMFLTQTCCCKATYANGS